MQRIYLLLSLILLSYNYYAQGDCNNAAPFCTGTTYNFPASTNTTSQTGPDYDCLGTQPNPAWYYLQVSQNGPIIIDMYSSSSVDIDFICWGPFTSPTGACTAGLNASAVVDCSYSTAAQETSTIPNAQVGEYYMLLITNFSGQPTNIVFSQSNAGAGGAGATNCNILCNIQSMTATSGPCNPATNTFDVSGTINTYAPPNSGTLTITTSCGGSTVINSPFTGTANYSVTGLPATGGSCTVTAQYSADPFCTYTVAINSPAPCTVNPCSITSVTSVAGACDPATNTFDVSGSVTFSNAPAGGTLTVSSSCGGSQTFNAPFTSPQTYTLTSLPSNGASCTVTAVFSASVSCTSTSTFTAPPSCITATCTTTAGNSGPICEGQTLNLTCGTSGATSYAWTGPNSFTASVQNPNISNATVAASGVYTVTVTNGGAVCVATTTVLINPSPNADAGPTVLICTGASAQLNASGGTSYSWTPATGLSNNSISNPSATPANTTLYTVVVGNNGCFSTDTVSVIVVNQITATASADVVICQGQSTQLTASGGSAYTWTPATALSAANIFNPVASPTVTTTYSVIVSAGSSCPTDTADVTVTVNPAFSITVSANDTICAGASGSVSASGALTYTWSPGGSANDSLTDSPLVTSTYTVSGTNGLCTDSATVSIVVLPSSVASFINNGQSELGNYSVCFTNSSAIFPGINCLWDFGDSDSSTAISPCHTYADAGIYNVCVTISSSFGCSDTYCENMELKPDWTFYVPNSFTPNGDFTNDVFYAYGSNLQSFEMFIFDRWGNNIYHSKDMTEGWNGTVNNKGAELVQIDTYVWKVKLKDSNGKQQIYVGHVNVVR